MFLDTSDGAQLNAADNHQCKPNAHTLKNKTSYSSSSTLYTAGILLRPTSHNLCDTNLCDSLIIRIFVPSNFTLENIRQQYHLGSYSNIPRLKTALINADLIDSSPQTGITITDPVFEQWIRKKMM